LDQFPLAITGDGRTLVFRQQTGNTARGDLYVMSLDGSGPGKPLFETPFIERSAAISPDGRWLAFDSNQSGRFEVYVRPFLNVAGQQWQVSANGGGRPIWSRSGRELFFLSADRNMMVADVRGTTEFSPSVPRKLFSAAAYYSSAYGLGVYDISADGRRFVMLKELPSNEPAEPPQLTVTINWASQPTP
jgi:serine/threonine-protein kinase